jgi:hypothetical protein
MALNVPKISDSVRVSDPKCTEIYLLTRVDAQKKVADVQSTKDPTVFHRDVPWDLLSSVDKNV